LPHTSDVVPHIFHLCPQITVIREGVAGPLLFLPRRVYVAPVGRTAQRNGKTDLAYQPAHRRLYGSSKNSKTTTQPFCRNDDACGTLLGLPAPLHSFISLYFKRLHCNTIRLIVVPGTLLVTTGVSLLALFQQATSLPIQPRTFLVVPGNHPVSTSSALLLNSATFQATSLSYKNIACCTRYLVPFLILPTPLSLLCFNKQLHYPSKNIWYLVTI